MSIFIAPLRHTMTPPTNALMSLMSDGKEMRFLYYRLKRPKAMAGSRNGSDIEFKTVRPATEKARPGAECAATKPRNIQLTLSSTRRHMLPLLSVEPSVTFAVAKHRCLAADTKLQRGAKATIKYRH